VAAAHQPGCYTFRVVMPERWQDTMPNELDLRGETCPYTFLRTRQALDTLPPGAMLRVTVDNAASAADVPRSLANAGHRVVTVERAAGEVWTITVCRREPG
jgi:tRNA 2-thiouridine synthesizing protein A